MFSTSDLELLLDTQDGVVNVLRLLSIQSDELSEDFQQGWMLATISLASDSITQGLTTLFPESSAKLKHPEVPDECPDSKIELENFFLEVDTYLREVVKLIAQDENISTENQETFDLAINKLINDPELR